MALHERDYMQQGSGRSPLREQSVTVKIIIATSIIFALQLFVNPPTDNSPGFFIEYLSLNANPELTVNAIALCATQLLTNIFIHADVYHIFFNLFALFIFGKIVEEYLPGKNFLILYLVSGILGSIGWFLLNIGEMSPLLGASGAVFGVITATMLMLPDRQVLLFFVFPIRIRNLVGILILINFVLMIVNFFGPPASGNSIAYIAHLGGVVGAYIVMKFKHREKIVFDPLGFLFKVTPQKRKVRYSPGYENPGLAFVEEEKNDAGESFEDDDDPMLKIDPILDKIGKHGMKSLSSEERRILEAAKEKLNDDS
ncbi:MAG: rhomboid family intramembrane serine protease [Lentisphaeria bacterium]|nr:rhomboid family intramembrane serine protease [Lentisphaeria bacterium]NQZ69340.1 rhomboid family intramembrane serine protease [Lentisphaeria bacterium]